MALKWIDSPKPRLAVVGWATLAALVTITPDDKLDLPALKRLLKRVEKEVRSADEFVKYQMNGFVVATACMVVPLTEFVLELAERIGPFKADLGNNDCQTPYAPDYIKKVAARGAVGKKRKSAKC